MRTAINADGQGGENTREQRFRALLELGRGGMARVFLAESMASGVRKLVVLKVLNGDLSLDPEMRAAFRREAEVSARVNHPNVVQVFEVVEHMSQPAIVMEYLDGLTLSRVLQKSSLPLALHLDVLSQVLSGLHHFHELKDLDETPLNAVHRDVSPQNVLVLHEGIAKVVDFGIAKVPASSDDQTRTGLIKGKIHYMPPEQLAGDGEIDRRADIFAVGVMLWEALAGRRMWLGMTSNQVVRALARGELPALRDVAPDAPRELQAIANRALQVERAARFNTAEDMQRALEHALTKTFGTVRRRELSGFMHQHFGEHRQGQRRLVDEARRNPNLGSGFSSPSAPSWPAASLPPEAAGSGARTFLVQPKARHSRRLIGLAAAGLLLSGLAVGVTVGRESALKVGSPPTTLPDEVHFQLLVEPAEAEILLDGVRLGVERYAGKRPRSRDPHQLEFRAAGYQSRREVIRFDDDVLRLIRLDPLPQELDPAKRSVLEEPPEVLGSSPLEAAQQKLQRRPVRNSSKLAARSDAPEPNAAEEPETSAAELLEPAASASPEVLEEHGALSSAASSAAAPPVTPSPAPAVAPRPTPEASRAPSIEKPRLVGSKAGHSHLSVNVSQDPYRPRLPKALNNVEQTFETSFAICVSPAGDVTSVKVISSADPAVDRQVSATIQRWRYRPLFEAGRAVPFCYPLRIQLTGG